MKLACAFTPAAKNLSRLFSIVAFAGLLGIAATSPLQAADSEGMPMQNPASIAALAPDGASAAQDAQGIAAIVNDHIISRYDLDQRVKLVMVTSGIPDNPETVNRIRGQVLRGLIDEILEIQESQRLELKVDPKDIEKEYNQIAARANMTPKEIDEYLSENGITKNALLSQIFAGIAWNKVIGQQFGPLINIGQDEVDEVLNRLKAEADQPRYLVSEILLTYDSPQQEQEMAGGAQRLVEQLRQGAPFAAVARQFSQSPSAANGGDIGWVHASQLPKDVAPNIEQMQIGAVSDPIQTLNGFYIVQLRNKQTGIGPDAMQDQWTLAHILLPLTPDAPAALVERRVAEAQKFIREFKTCDGIPDQIKSIIGAVAQAPRTVSFGQLDQRIREALAGAKPGHVLTPIRSAQGFEMIAVCDYKADATAMPTRDDIEDNLFSQQLSMMARRHLRDLRRDAVIDIR